LRNIEAYYERSGMNCNGEKAEAMLCTLNNRLQPSNFPPFRYDGQEIRISYTLRHLGVIFDRQLNFFEHVNSVLQIEGALQQTVIRSKGSSSKLWYA